MNQKECELRNGCKPKLSFLLLSFLMVTGCATLGDIEAENEKNSTVPSIPLRKNRENPKLRWGRK